MRILVEVMAADFGGIRTYAENLLSAWERELPHDELSVVVPEDSTIQTFGHTRHAVRIPSPAVIGRPWAQTTTVRRIAQQMGAEAVLATMPVTSLLRTGVPTAVVVHDLRHEIRPEQFSPGRRLIRRVSYGRGYRVADGFIAVSQRTLDDLHRLHPTSAGRPGVVVHHGADHALRWPGDPGTGPAVTFAHHTNKNPALVLDGWALGRDRGDSMPRLLVLGTGSIRERLQARVEELGLAGTVELAPFLPDDEFVTVMRSASMIVFPSDFEGFGLPVVEGMVTGVPVVIGPDAATLEVAGGHASVLADWTPEACADAVDRAARFDAAHLEKARAHAARFTWARCAEQTRTFLEQLATAAR
jgi:glycosyltransferase involved in cell wall biosynthesis